jgi:probable rRNA maturation factor
MTIDLQINNTTQSPIADGFLQKVAEATLGHLMSNDHNDRRTSSVHFLADKNISVSLALVVPEEIKKINKNYRQHDDVTDVLSFAEYGSIEEIKNVVDSDVFLGELILCYDDIKEYAADAGIKLEKELANVVSHGILHLLGFEHGEKMFLMQEKVKNNF